MFRCEMCQTVVPARTRSTKVVTATRPRTYSSRGSEPRERGDRGGFRSRFKMKTKTERYDKGGVGREIVRELSVCPACAERWRIEHAEAEANLAAAAAAAAPAVEQTAETAEDE